MSWQQIGVIILGSGVFAALLTIIGTWLKEWYFEKDKIKKEQEYQLYSQLRFYLKLLNITNSTREELMADTQKAYKERTSHIQDAQRKGELLIKKIADSRKFTLKLINDRWAYIESIKKILEDNPKYIKNEDWSMIERFFKEYFIREIVTGKGVYKDTSNLFTDEKEEEAFENLFKVIDEMYEKIK